MGSDENNRLDSTVQGSWEEKKKQKQFQRCALKEEEHLGRLGVKSQEQAFKTKGEYEQETDLRKHCMQPQKHVESIWLQLGTQKLIKQKQIEKAGLINL